MDFQIPGVDVEKGLSLYDEDEDLFVIVLSSYAKNTPVVLDRLRNVSQENLAEYAANVHGIKGTSTAIGAEDLRKTALKLEMMAKAGDLSGVLAENDAFLKQADALVRDVQTWLENNT